MADDAFNGATITLASVTIGPLRSISVTNSAAKADVTYSTSTAKAYDPGIPDMTVTCEIVGGAAVAVGDTGDLDIAWNDIGGSTLGSIASAACVSVATNGSMDGEITTTVEFCTAAPTA